MKKIQKVTMTTVILMEADSPDAARAELEAMEQADIVAEMDDGSYLGKSSIEKVETVAPDELEDECDALNGDVSFFVDPLDDDEKDDEHADPDDDR